MKKLKAITSFRTSSQINENDWESWTQIKTFDINDPISKILDWLKLNKHNRLHCEIFFEEEEEKNEKNN